MPFRSRSQDINRMITAEVRPQNVEPKLSLSVTDSLFTICKVRSKQPRTYKYCIPNRGQAVSICLYDPNSCA